MDAAAVRTYQYLRVGILALIAVLAVSLLVEISRSTGPVCRGIAQCGSISAFFYTPVRTVFVGTLIATGFALIVLRGRPGWEDVLLNVVGILAVGVAIVPAPLQPGVVAAITDTTAPTAPTVPSEFRPAVANNVLAFGLIGLAGVAVALLLAARARELTTANVTAISLTAVVLVGYMTWHALGLESFLRAAHYVAAMPMFLIMAIIVEINARASAARPRGKGLSQRQFAKTYRVLAVTMIAVLVAAVAIFLAQQVAGWVAPAGWLFWVEAILIAQFGSFWLLQTLDYWQVGTPA
ncbi:MAG: hypothetical protein ACK5MP_13055 [Nostocoides sp.]